MCAPGFVRFVRTFWACWGSTTLHSFHWAAAGWVSALPDSQRDHERRWHVCFLCMEETAWRHRRHRKMSSSSQLTIDLPPSSSNTFFSSFDLSSTENNSANWALAVLSRCAAEYKITQTLFLRLLFAVHSTIFHISQITAIWYFVFSQDEILTIVRKRKKMVLRKNRLWF